MQHSPRLTRSQAASEAGSEARRTVATAEREEERLQTILGELQQLREERTQERRELAELRRRMGAGESGESGQGQSVSNYKLKPDNYDGTGSFLEYITQFELIARANAWGEEEKGFVFAACLRGRARSVLGEIGENFRYAELKSKLELRFGECKSFQNYYFKLTNRKLGFGEDFATFGGDLERLVRMAYPECEYAVRDKIACAQFVAGLSEGLVKQTLQLEGIISLQEAIERAKVVSAISKRENFGRGQGFRGGEARRGFNSEGEDKGRNLNFEREGRNGFPKNPRTYLREVGGRARGGREGNFRENKERKGGVRGECWQCGSREHFRAECPSFLNQEK